MSFGRGSVRFVIPLIAAALAIAVIWGARPPKLAAGGGPVAVPTDLQIPSQSFEVEPVGTVDLSSLPPADFSAFNRPHKRFLPRDPAALAAWKQKFQSGGTGGAAPSPALTSTDLFGFEGMNVNTGCGGCEPPDTYVAVGPNDVFETVNVAARITDKSGTPARVQGAQYSVQYRRELFERPAREVRRG